MPHYEIIECLAWKKPGCNNAASNQVGMEARGYKLENAGWRLKRDGVTLYPARKPFASKMEAELERARLLGRNEI